VSLNGDASTMPWNSSKSDISTKHEVFVALDDWLVQVVKDYAALSRIWMGEWPEKVFKYKKGHVEEVPVDDFPTAHKSFLPPLPKSRPRYGEIIEQRNKSISKKKPWTRGLYEGVIAADLIAKQRLEQKNRIAFIVFDSTLEIAFKEYLVNESGASYNDAKLLSIFGNRSTVHAEIKKYINLSKDTWKKIEHYYRLRCKLVQAGAAAMSLVLAAHALGYGANWITEWYAYDRGVLDALGLAQHERIAGFIHIGRPPAPPEDRPRPPLNEIAVRFTA
jgi:nitroreductase